MTALNTGILIVYAILHLSHVGLFIDHVGNDALHYLQQGSNQMFTPDIILNDGVADRTYSLTQQRTTSSLRSDATRDVTTPRYVTIAHEKAKDGTISSVIYIDSEEVIACNDTCATTPTIDKLRVQLKIVRNPLSGRATIEEDVEELLEQVINLITEGSNRAKFLNQES